MVKYFYRNVKEDKFKVIDKFRVGSWIHVVNPTDDELAELVEQFRVDEGHLRDATDIDEMPRLEMEPEATYVFTRFAYSEDNQVQTSPVLIVVGANFLMTVAPRELPMVDHFVEGKVNFYTTQKAKLLLQILSRILATYSTHLNSISRQVRASRARLKVENIKNRDFVKFVAFEDVLNDFLSELIPTNVILNSLLYGKKNLVFYEDDRDLIEDLSLSTGQLVESIKSNLKTIVNIRDAYSNIMTNNLNREVKLLTTLTVVLTIPTILGGLFGMNVRLPLSETSPWSFWIVLAIIVGLSGGMLWVLNRKRWF